MTGLYHGTWATPEDQKDLRPLAKIAKGFAGNAPLWAYILSEAQVTSWEKADSVAPWMTSLSSSGPWGARSSPRCSPPRLSATVRPI